MSHLDLDACVPRLHHLVGVGDADGDGQREFASLFGGIQLEPFQVAKGRTNALHRFQQWSVVNTSDGDAYL